MSFLSTQCVIQLLLFQLVRRAKQYFNTLRFTDSTHSIDISFVKKAFSILIELRCSRQVVGGLLNVNTFEHFVEFFPFMLLNFHHR